MYILLIPIIILVVAAVILLVVCYLKNRKNRDESDYQDVNLSNLNDTYAQFEDYTETDNSKVRSSIRLALGLYYNQNSYEEYRGIVMNMALPEVKNNE